MRLPPRRIPFELLLAVLAAPTGVEAQEALGVDAYVAIVLRAHPAARQGTALEAAAAAERRAGRLLPDPAFEYTQDKARPAGVGPSVTERAFAVSQTIPWPGTWSANKDAGDRAAEALRTEATSARWEIEIEARTTFARLLHARAAVEMARAAEADALALRDLTAKRASLGESRESDRIKAEVEFLRQKRLRMAAEREVLAAEAIVRTLAVEPLPRPLAVVGELPRSAAPTDPAVLEERLRASPRLLQAQAEASRDAALASAARRSRIPDVDVTWFHEDELDKEANGFSFGIRVPLWNARRGEIARTEAAAVRTGAGAERARLDAQAALERARADLDTASAHAEMLDEQILPQAKRSLDLARFSYEEGETSLLDLLDAQRTFRETQGETAAARLALVLSIAEVQRLVGPDWNPWR